MAAMIKVEQGVQPYGTPELLAAAKARLGNEAVPSGQTAPRVEVNQKTEIHVHGDTTPNATARSVYDGQARVNGDLVRNLSTAIK